MKKLISICAFALPFLLQAQTDILDARTNFSIGQTVTVTGIVTNGESLGSVRYIQDETAGIAIYPGTTWDTVEPQIGDEITVNGELSEFMGLLEVGPNLNSVDVNSSGNALPDYQPLTPSQMGEEDEGEMVSIEGCIFENAGGVFQGNTSYTFTSGEESAEMYVRTSNFLVGESIPFGEQNLFGIVSQFSDSGDDGYQLLVLSLDGIVSASAINITSPISQDNVTTTSFDISWTTDVNGDSFVEYGTDPNSLDDELYNGDETTDHSLTLEGLEPATVYYVRVTSANADGSAASSIIPFITRSTSEGDITVWFTKEVDTSVATVEEAISLGADMNDSIASFISQAQSTLDFAIYNINDQTIVSAINEAAENGVQIRYIAQGTNLNAGIESFDESIAVWEREDDFGSGMHNKFVIRDREDIENAAVLTGSLNFTTQGIVNDYNNVIIFQDQSLAVGFTLEFEEMWGGSGMEPNPAESRFGEDKTINTPSQYFSGDVPVEVYFSPTDNTTYRLQQAILSANTEANFATLAFTRDDLRDAMIAVQEDFFSYARGVIEQTGGTGVEYEALVDAGVDVLDHQGISGQCHHKYAIIDAVDTESDPLVATGSHNWSNSAENINDENTVIVHDARVANLYYQEFNNLFDSGNSIAESEFSSLMVYPNPANDYVRILNASGLLQVWITDMQGRRLGEYTVPGQGELNVSDLPQGLYTLTIRGESGDWSSTFIKR